MLLPLLWSTALADEALRERLRPLLGGIDSPPVAADFAGFDATAGAELIDLSRDASLLPYQRANAIVALGWVPRDESNHAFLTTLLADRGADPLLRRKSAWALANGWGRAALPALDVAMRDPDPLLRNAALRAAGGVR